MTIYELIREKGRYIRGRIEFYLPGGGCQPGTLKQLIIRPTHRDRDEILLVYVKYLTRRGTRDGIYRQVFWKETEPVVEWFVRDIVIEESEDGRSITLRLSTDHKKSFTIYLKDGDKGVGLRDLVGHGPGPLSKELLRRFEFSE